MKAIIAVNKKGIIGNGDSLPWRCSEDLKHFKKMTMNSTCLVGRKTWESMPKLEGRNLIVVGSGNNTSLDVALMLGIDWVIGGKSIYEQTLHLCDELHISIINDYSDGDVKCPDLSTFMGETFIYNFEPNVKKSEPTKIDEILKQNELVKNATEYIKTFEQIFNIGLSHFKICKHEIFEQKLIEGGMSLEQAKNQIRFLVCTCPKCINRF